MPISANVRSELKAKGFNRAIETMSPGFDVEEIDIHTSVIVMTNTLNRSGPLLVLKFPGRPLDIIPITTPLVYGQKKGAILSNNVGHEFERVITRQEHGIPKQSKHFRVVRFRFGQLSLALTKEGMSNFSKFATGTQEHGALQGYFHYCRRLIDTTLSDTQQLVGAWNPSANTKGNILATLHEHTQQNTTDTSALKKEVGRVIKAGFLAQQSDLVEVKLRSFSRATSNVATPLLLQGSW
jgi:hypothetical protein